MAKNIKKIGVKRLPGAFKKKKAEKNKLQGDSFDIPEPFIVMAAYQPGYMGDAIPRKYMTFSNLLDAVEEMKRQKKSGAFHVRLTMMLEDWVPKG